MIIVIVVITIIIIDLRQLHLRSRLNLSQPELNLDGPVNLSPAAGRR